MKKKKNQINKEVTVNLNLKRNTYCNSNLSV